MVNLKYPFQRIADEFSDKFYDRQYGIETCQQIEVEQLGISTQDAENARKYQATPYLQLLKIFKYISEKYPNWSLMDVGCGKGRVLAVAANHGANEVIGIDLSKELISNAEQNIKQLKVENSVTKFKLLPENVLDVEFDRETDFYFLFNPFDTVILQKFIEKYKLEARQDAQVIIVNSIRMYVWHNAGFKIEKKFEHSNSNFEAFILSST